MKKLANQVKNTVTFITGASKNAGKTTFLNYLAQQLRQSAPVLIATIGVDGEGQDLVFGNAKPLIFANTSDFILTTDAALKASCGFFRIIRVFSVSTVLGKMVLAEVLRGDFVEIIGPETNSQLAQILRIIEQDLGKCTILIDGAASRVTQVAASVGAGVIDVIKLTSSTISSTLERLKFYAWVVEHSDLPAQVVATSETHAHNTWPANWVIAGGAFTMQKFLALPPKITALVLDDYGCIFVDLITLQKIPCPVYFKNPINLQAIVINAIDVDENLFFTQIKELPISNLIYFNPYKVYEKTTWNL